MIHLPCCDSDSSDCRSMLASLLHTNREADEPLSAEKSIESSSETDDDMSKPPKFRQLTLNKQWQPTTTPASKPAPSRRHATLVITPVSLAKQWQEELDRMSVKGSLRSVLWYGNERPDLSALLDTTEVGSRTDVVITSYGTLVSEHAKWLTRQGVRSQLKSLFDSRFSAMGCRQHGSNPYELKFHGYVSS